MKNKKGFLELALILIAVFLVSVLAVGLFNNFVGGKLSIFGDDSVQFTWTQQYDTPNLKIGDLTFAPQKPKFTCRYVQDRISYPSPKADCWVSPLTFQSLPYQLLGGREVSLNENIKVEMSSFGHMRFNHNLEKYEFTEEDDWKNTYKFKLEGVELSSTAELQTKIVQLGSKQNLLLTVTNPLANFDKNHAGAWIRTKHSLLPRGEIFETKKFAIKKGTAMVQIPLDTSELGKVNVEIQPFVEIMADEQVVIFQKQPIKVSYEVVQELPNNTNNKQQNWFQKLINIILGWFK